MADIRKAVSDFFSHRQHPVKLVDYTSRNLWLLIIPLSKYLIASHFDLREWIRTNWVDILTLIGIFAFAVLRWIFVSFSIEEDGIVAHSGFFGIVRTKLYYKQITTVSFCQKWYARPFSASTIYIETNARTVQKEDVRLVMSRSNSDKLYDYVSAISEVKPGIAEYSPRKLHLFVFSLLFSSALTGVVLYATFMYQSYKIVGLEVQQVVERVNNEIIRIDSNTLKLTKKLPRAIIWLAGIAIGSWFISFITTLARHWSFTVSCTNRQFFIKSGVFIKRRHIINRDKINYYDITQTLLMKIFKICSVTLNCTGYGKSRREISALIPITTYDQMNSSLKLLVPDLPRPRPEIRTGSPTDIRRFVTLPVLMCLVPPYAIKLLNKYFPHHNMDINALLAILTIPLVWLVIVKTAAAFNTSVGFDEDGCVLNYCKGYKFHKLLLPKNNISMIRIIRNPLQLTNNTCTLCIFTVGEQKSAHLVKFMPYDKVCDMCRREGFI